MVSLFTEKVNSARKVLAECGDVIGRCVWSKADAQQCRLPEHSYKWLSAQVSCSYGNIVLSKGCSKIMCVNILRCKTDHVIGSVAIEQWGDLFNVLYAI
jgi:hypothetical protein